MNKEDNKKTYNEACSHFLWNISAVRVLGLEIAKLGDEHDKETAEKFIADMTKIFPDLPLEESSEKDITSISAEAGQSVSIQNEIAPADTAENKPPKIDLNDEQLDLLLRAAKSFAARPPVQGALLRNGALITLTSFFECLVSEFLHIYYCEHPSALPAQTHSLSLADLRGLGSIQDAEQFITSKEIDSLLRESVADQLDYFSKTRSVDLAPLDDIRTELTEVFQRRNLLVHNSGIVNRYYLERVSPDLIARFKVEEDKRLAVSPTYLKAAIDIVQASGLMLLQQCWRKWNKAEINDADTLLINALYESLKSKNFDLTIRLSKYALGVPFCSDDNRRLAAINLAIALKELQKEDELHSLIKRFDWTACSLKYQVALAALENKDERLFNLLPKALACGEITSADLSDWPIFNQFRDDGRFKSIISAAKKNASDGL